MADPRGARASPLFLDQTEAQRAEKNFLGDCPPSLFKGLDDQAPPPPLISRSGSGTAVAGKMAILLLRIQGKSQGYGEHLPIRLS